MPMSGWSAWRGWPAAAKDRVRREAYELAGPFPFTKGCQVLKIPSRGGNGQIQFGNLLFDLQKDPGQTSPMEDREIEARMIWLMGRLMKLSDAPTEQVERLGLKKPD